MEIFNFLLLKSEAKYCIKLAIKPSNNSNVLFSLKLDILQRQIFSPNKTPPF